jgi:hypothetical protein
MILIIIIIIKHQLRERPHPVPHEHRPDQSETAAQALMHPWLGDKYR